MGRILRDVAIAVLFAAVVYDHAVAGDTRGAIVLAVACGVFIVFGGDA